MGEKIETTVTVESVSTFDGQWGLTYRVNLVDQAGNALIWWASNDILKRGQTVVLKATVKKHDTFTPNHDGARAIKQTVITRAKVVRVIAAETEEVPA